MEETADQSTEKTDKQVEVSISEGIVLQNVSYAYEGRTDPVLQDVNLEILAGASVGIIGASGEGKTTLLDILLGLLTPDTGCVEVDGVPVGQCSESFMNRTAYVPQTIFLLDDTIRNNVAMGYEEEHVQDADVWNALEKAALSNKVRSLPAGLDTQIGEKNTLIWRRETETGLGSCYEPKSIAYRL